MPHNVPKISYFRGHVRRAVGGYIADVAVTVTRVSLEAGGVIGVAGVAAVSRVT